MTKIQFAAFLLFGVLVGSSLATNQSGYDTCVQKNGGKSSFPSSDGCNICGCQPDGSVACTMKTCVPAPSGSKGSYDTCVETHGGKSSFPSSDGCNMCGCQSDGSVACTMKACVPAPPSTSSYDMCLQQNGGKKAWTHSDGCNTCGCTNDGNVACTQISCGASAGPYLVPKSDAFASQPYDLGILATALAAVLF